MSKAVVRPKGEPSVPAVTREKYDAVMALIDPFCQQRLNEEYAATCRRLAAVLARKRPSPLASGTPAVWACAIVRVVGWVNFLDDPAQKPHMKLTAVDKVFGVSSNTGQTKSKAIRDLLKIHSFDPEWTLPGRVADNPKTWLIGVNGMVLDARYVPRPVQEEAFRRGMIPYIPADKPGAAAPVPERKDEPQS